MSDKWSRLWNSDHKPNDTSLVGSRPVTLSKCLRFPDTNPWCIYFCSSRMDRSYFYLFEFFKLNVKNTNPSLVHITGKGSSNLHKSTLAEYL